MPHPRQINIQADIELEVTVSAKILDEFNARPEGFMNLRVGIDIPIFPNIYNIIVLKDAYGERESIIAQCKSFYDPDKEELSAGAVPYVRLDRQISALPDAVLDRLTAKNPNVIESGENQGTIIVQV